jgi:hypothetical protein
LQNKKKMKETCLTLLFAFTLATACFDGDLYLFSQAQYSFYQANSASGAIDSSNFNTNCFTISGTNAGSNVVVSCLAQQSSATTLQTIAENKVQSSVTYNLPCSVSPLSYDSGRSKIVFYIS